MRTASNHGLLSPQDLIRKFTNSGLADLCNPFLSLAERKQFPLAYHTFQTQQFILLALLILFGQ